jgi:hypothetical protein
MVTLIGNSPSKSRKVGLLGLTCGRDPALKTTDALMLEMLMAVDLLITDYLPTGSEQKSEGKTGPSGIRFALLPFAANLDDADRYRSCRAFLKHLPHAPTPYLTRQGEGKTGPTGVRFALLPYHPAGR